MIRLSPAASVAIVTVLIAVACEKRSDSAAQQGRSSAAPVVSEQRPSEPRSLEVLIDSLARVPGEFQQQPSGQWGFSDGTTLFEAIGAFGFR